MSKRAVLLLTLVLVLAVSLSVKAAFASIPTPSVPEFNVKLVDTSYDVPTTYSIDPYTGENITREGYHVERTSIQVSIKNQPFTSFRVQETDSAAIWEVNFYYNIRVKGHFVEDWIELYRPSDGFLSDDSESEYTVITYSSEVYGTKLLSFPPGGKVDFQVEAMIGYVHREIPTFALPGTGWVFTGETSGWSDTQTLTMPTGNSMVNSESPSPTSDAQQTIPFEAVLGATIVIITLSLSLGFLGYLIRQK